MRKYISTVIQFSEVSKVKILLWEQHSDTSSSSFRRKFILLLLLLLNNLLGQKIQIIGSELYIPGTVVFFCVFSVVHHRQRYSLDTSHFICMTKKLTFATRKISRTFQRIYTMFRNYFSCLINEKLWNSLIYPGMGVSVSISQGWLQRNFWSSLICSRMLNKYVSIHFSIYGCSR